MEATQQHPHEMQPTNLEASVAVMAVEMRYVRAGIEELKTGQTQTVPRSEWEQWKQLIEKELASRRVPWTSVGAFIVAGAGLLLVVVEKFGN